MRLRLTKRDVFGHGLLGTLVEGVVHLPHHGFCNLQQLTVLVVWKVDVMGNTRAHAWIRLEKGVHPIFVARQDDNQVFSIVLHDLQKNLDRLLTVVALVLWAVEVIRLIDEQHPAHGLLEHVLGLGGRVPNVLTDEIVSRHAHHVTFADITQAMQDGGHLHGHRGLASTRVAGKAHMQ